MNTQQLKKAILQEAISGRLTAQWREENGVTEEWKVVKNSDICKLTKGEDKTGDYVYMDAAFLRGKDKKEIHNSGNFVKKGSAVILVDGENSGEVFDIPCDGYMGSTFKELTIFDIRHKPYILLLLLSYKDLLRNNKTGSAIPHLNKKLFAELEISLPPIEEQREIVRRVEEMFGEIEKIEEGKEKMEVLGRMLKKRVLEEAISGRLVSNEMEPGEKTAEQLLKDILAERQKNDPKKAKTLSPIDEEPWTLPEGWKWCRLGEIVKNRDSERIPLSVGTREKMLTKKYDYYGPGGAFDKVEDYIFDKRLLLIGEDGANLLTQSKPNAFFADGKYWVNNHVHVLDSYCDDIILEIIAIRINSMSLEAYVTGSAQPKLNQDKLNMIPIPLPPISIQKRIVKMINYTFEIMDKQINNNL